MDLIAAGEVEGLLEGSQHPVHLLCCQCGGSAAAHVEGPAGKALLADHLPSGADLPDQRVYIGRHQGEAPLHGLAHEGAVGAAGGAEGDAHIDRDIPGIQLLLGGQGGGACLQGQRRPVRGDEICFLQHLAGLLGRLSLGQGPGHRLVRPYAGEHPPGGRVAGQLPGGQEEGCADGVAALALPGEVVAAERTAVAIWEGLALVAQLHRDVAALLLPEGDDGPGVIAGQDRLIDGLFSGEQAHQALFHHVALIMAP